MLPQVIKDVILDMAASMTEYEHRVRVHREMYCAYYFRSIRLLYTNLYSLWDTVPLLQSP